MDEKTFKLIGNSGIMNIVFGVIAIAVGTAAGVLLIISGAKLLRSRKKLIF